MMSKKTKPFAWDGPFGYKMQVTVCVEELCQQPHILIWDEDNKPLAAMVVPHHILDVLKAWGDESAVAELNRKRSVGMVQ